MKILVSFESETHKTKIEESLTLDIAKDQNPRQAVMSAVHHLMKRGLPQSNQDWQTAGTIKIGIQKL